MIEANATELGQDRAELLDDSVGEGEEGIFGAGGEDQLDAEETAE